MQAVGSLVVGLQREGVSGVPPTPGTFACFLSVLGTAFLPVFLPSGGYSGGLKEINLWQISSIKLLSQPTQDTVRHIFTVGGRSLRTQDSPHSKDWRPLLLNMGRKDWVYVEHILSPPPPPSRGTHNG